MKVSATELRAWARASQKIAMEEGFDGVADAVGEYIHDVHTFEILPVK